VGELQFHLPVESLRPVHLDELIDVASEEAQRVLRTACLLAARRVHGVKEVAARIAAIENEPWPLPRRTSPSTSSTITQADLVRALVACEPEAVGVAFSASSRSLQHLFDASKAIRASLDGVSGSGPEVLERAFGIRWRLARARGLTSLGLKHLLGAVDEDGHRAIARFDDRFVEGLVTEDEAYYRSLEGQSHVWRFPPVPRIIADRIGAIARIGEALERHAIVQIVSPAAHCGRRTWVEHVLQDRAPRRLASDSEFQIGNAWYYLGSEAQTPLFDIGLGRNALLWALVKGGELDERGSLRLRLGDSRVSSGRGEIGRSSAADLDEVLRLSQQHPERLRILVSLTTAESSALSAAVPRLADSFRIELPGGTDRDLLPRWLSLALEFTDDEGQPVEISKLMSAFATATNEEKSTVDRSVLRAALRRHCLSGAHDVWRSRLRLVRMRQREGRQLPSYGEFVERYVGNGPDILAIAELAALVDPGFDA
jgi:hypothetical protein